MGTGELGDFLRARRGETQPGDAGLPDLGERRVPGLRREEVALLAGVSTDYYTRLEQGRERHPSGQVLAAIGRALGLDAAAVTYMFRLVGAAPSVAESIDRHEVRDSLLQFVLNDVDAPATLTGPTLDVLAANDRARSLYGSFARFDNLVRMVFLDPAAKRFYADWDNAARGVVSNLRATSAAYVRDQDLLTLLGELTARSPAFVDYWQRHEVRPRTNELKQLHHPVVGDLTLRYQSFRVDDNTGQHMFVYTAAPGSASAEALTRLPAPA